MNEFKSFSENLPILSHIYLRFYRENGKLRIEALREALPRSYDSTMEFYRQNTHKIRFYIYFDGVEQSFKLIERIQSKVYSYFTGRDSFFVLSFL